MTMHNDIPEIRVGIVSGSGLTFTLNGTYLFQGGDLSVEGQWTAMLDSDRLILKNGEQSLDAAEGIVLEPNDPEKDSFTLHAVTIGVNFHWQRDEDQLFRGKLKFIKENGKITAINILSIEDYLISVISSEMSATSSLELLKAHAVISRSWVLAQIEKRNRIGEKNSRYQTCFRTPNEIIKWYDREDHLNFDVCADDHCQRYQGITRANTAEVTEAVNNTCGELLTYNDEICDARFSKCCGGVAEMFENVWEPVHHPYLSNIIDNAEPPESYALDLTYEKNAVAWIAGNPAAFCNTNDKVILSQVLNSYDQETNDFYRWKLLYSQEELSELVKQRSGIDFGLINNLIPLTRGASGRIVRLRIEGSLKTMVIGKELEIRKYLSKTHLYSSAFFVEKKEEDGRQIFILNGAGWGHGVGLCQIGAAVMSAKGYNYRQILNHYFINSSLEKRY